MPAPGPPPGAGRVLSKINLKVNKYFGDPGQNWKISAFGLPALK